MVGRATSNLLIGLKPRATFRQNRPENAGCATRKPLIKQEREQTENHGVGGSIPPLGTITSIA
jgi:hypothetical protein